MATTDVALQDAGGRLERKRIVNDMSIQVATVNGSGSQSSNTVLSAQHFPDGRSGFRQEPVSLEHCRASDLVHNSRQQKRLHRSQEGNRLPDCDESGDSAGRRDVARARAAALYDEPLKLNELRNDLTFYAVPYDKLVAPVCPEAKLRKLVKNMIYVGRGGPAARHRHGEVEKAIRKQFAKKVKAANLNLARRRRAMTMPAAI